MGFKPFRFKKICKSVSSHKIAVLDVGSGSHSATLTKKWMPNVIYTGVDMDKNYQNTNDDFENMDFFIEMDVTKLDFAAIKDDHYDVIILSHIIEHLYNGDLVLKGLMSKLKDNGIFYIEYPKYRFHENLYFVDCTQ